MQAKPAVKLTSGDELELSNIMVALRARQAPDPAWLATLNPSQRALIAAQAMPQRRQYGYAGVTEQQITLGDVSKLMGVSEALISLARVCLKGGTPEQLAAVRDGQASVNTLGHAVRARERGDRPPAPAPDASSEERKQARNETVRLQSRMWGHLRDGLNHLAELPRPSELVTVARRQDRGLIERRLDKAIKWLEEFRNDWRSSRNGEDADKAET